MACLAAIASALYAMKANRLAQRALEHSDMMERIITATQFDGLSLSIDKKTPNDPSLWKVYDSPPKVIDMSCLETDNNVGKISLQSFALFVLGIFNTVFSFIDEREKKVLKCHRHLKKHGTLICWNLQGVRRLELLKKPASAAQPLAKIKAQHVTNRYSSKSASIGLERVNRNVRHANMLLQPTHIRSFSS